MVRQQVGQLRKIIKTLWKELSEELPPSKGEAGPPPLLCSQRQREQLALTFRVKLHSNLKITEKRTRRGSS